MPDPVGAMERAAEAACDAGTNGNERLSDVPALHAEMWRAASRAAVLTFLDEGEKRIPMNAIHEEVIAALRALAQEKQP